MEQPGSFQTLLHALVYGRASYDDTRFEKLFSYLVENLPHVAAPDSLSLLHTGLLHCQDFRKVAVCCRLLGHWALRFGDDLVDLSFALRHREALLRHAAVYALRVALPGGAAAAFVASVPWIDLLLDESMWVHNEVICAETFLLPY
jgi:hypothetical protein